MSGVRYTFLIKINLVTLMSTKLVFMCSNPNPNPKQEEMRIIVMIFFHPLIDFDDVM